MTDTNEEFMGFTPNTGGGGYETLPEGTYDFVIHGVVGLGLHKKVYQGKEMRPEPKIKLIFEIPEHIRKDGQTELLTIKFPLSNNEKSNFYKFCTAVLGASVTSNEENMKKLCYSAGLKSLLGHSGTLTVVTWTNGEGRSVDNKGFYPLHPKVAKPVATREPIFFNPFNPDIDVFKNKLTAYTRKEIMEAVNADSFKEELKQAYAETLVADASAKANYTSGNKKEKIDENAPWANGEAIQ